MNALILRRRALISSLSSVGGGGADPSVGTVSPLQDSVIASGQRQYTLSHSGAGSHLLVCIAIKGQTDVGPPTYTIDKATYNSVPMTKIGENDLNLLAGQPTLIAFLLANPSAGVNDVEFDITPSTNDTQCLTMAAINISDCTGLGTGFDSDGSGGAATTADNQSIDITSSAANSLIVGVTAVRRADNLNTISTPTGYTEHLEISSGGFSNTTDIVMAVHSVLKTTAGVQNYTTTWNNSASYGSMGFELLGTP